MTLRSLTRTALLGAALAATAPWVLAPAPAYAVSLAPLSVEQMTDAASYIVRGTVTRVWTELDEFGDVWTKAEVEVAQVHKGTGLGSTIVIGSLGGEHKGQRLVLEGAATYSVGEELLVFLDKVRGDRLTPVGLFTGKYTIRRAPGETRHHVMTWYASPNERFDARFLPHPAPEARVYLDDLLQQVEARLDVGWDGEPVPGISNERLQRVNTPERRLRR